MKRNKKDLKDLFFDLNKIYKHNITKLTNGGVKKVAVTISGCSGIKSFDFKLDFV